MKRNTGQSRSRIRGFTLVEILVVLAILVLLVGMVAPRVLKSQKKADVSNARAQIGMLRSCLERYAVDMKNFPATEQGLRALVSPPAEGETAGSSGWDGPYVNQDSIPKDPWGNDYQYEYPPTHGKGDYPDIWSLGPDGQADTEDDIVSWSKTDGGQSTETDQTNQNTGAKDFNEPAPPPDFDLGKP